jgi:DNA-binding NarL/FixJ family response regulator
VDRTLRLAVVDADAETRAGLARYLGGVAGLSVVALTGDVAEALRVVADQRPDVVVMDPRGLHDGATLVSRLAAFTAVPRVVVLTTVLTAEARAALLAAGVRTVLLKHIDGAALVGAIRGAAAGTACGTGYDRT